jgi:hypothetical protein
MTQNLSYPEQTTDSTLGFFDRQECITMNLKFAKAMLSARQRGEESFTIGAKIDHTPLVGAYFDKQLRHSPMSSGAAACLNMTLDTSRPAAMPSVSRRMPDGFK